MTTDVLADAVFAEAVPTEAEAIDEAEAIVRAEWIRLTHDNGDLDNARCAACAEMPARPRPPSSAALAAVRGWPAPVPPQRTPWPPRRGPRRRRVWPRQRSPPQAS